MSLIRPAHIGDAPAIARVHVDTWRTTYAGIVPNAHLAGLRYERSEAAWGERLSDPHSATHAFVAEAQPGHIVGFASGGPLQEPLAGFDGELYVLYVLQPFQRMGYGRRLVAQVADDLATRTFRTLVVWVLRDNPARGFYERLGGRLEAEKVIEIGGRSLVDVAYAWSDLIALSCCASGL